MRKTGSNVVCYVPKTKRKFPTICLRESVAVLLARQAGWSRAGSLQVRGDLPARLAKRDGVCRLLLSSDQTTRHDLLFTNCQPGLQFDTCPNANCEYAIMHGRRQSFYLVTVVQRTKDRQLTWIPNARHYMQRKRRKRLRPGKTALPRHDGVSLRR